MVKNVAIIMGSISDVDVAKKAFDELESLSIPYTARVMSAHRTPDAVRQFCTSAAKNGFGVVIAFAGKAAHLAGVIAAYTNLPVIGVPVESHDLGGLDALLSTAQMPSGVPVATVAINGGANSAWLAARILALTDSALAQKLEQCREEMAAQTAKADAELQARLSDHS